MGVESDQLVYDYLSRVGDLAQTALAADQRARLVARLRTDIDRERGSGASAATVQRILGKLGSPDEVVKAAAGARAAAPPEPGPGQRPQPVPKPGPGPGPVDPEPRSVPRTEMPGPRTGEPDWWRVGDPAVGQGWQSGESIGLPPGMTGGLTIPRPDPAAEGEPGEADGRAAPDGAASEPEPRAQSAARRWLRLRSRLRARKPGSVSVPTAQKAGPRRGGLLELLGVASLVAGAILGTWLALALGWLIAYTSRRLSRREAKFAALGLPGLVVGGTAVWLWGRMNGRWGGRIADGQLGTAIVDSVPAVVRIAAVASALFLLWRSRRPSG
jgi:hypothetical protein